MARASGARGSRAEAKEATRARILNAAEAMFSERGWDATTLRDVAAESGSSIGAIFFNFPDKVAVLQAVLERDIDRLMTKMRACAETEDRIDDALLAIFMCGYNHYGGRLPLLLALRRMMWAEEGQPIREMLARVPLYELLLGRLRIAALWGELEDRRLEARSHMLLDAYLANYGQALYGGWDLKLLRKRSKTQIEVILAGAKPRRP